VLNFDGKYLCKDNDKAIANAPPLTTWLRKESDIFLNESANLLSFSNYYCRAIISDASVNIIRYRLPRMVLIKE